MKAWSIVVPLLLGLAVTACGSNELSNDQLASKLYNGGYGETLLTSIYCTTEDGKRGGRAYNHRCEVTNTGLVLFVAVHAKDWDVIDSISPLPPPCTKENPLWPAC